MTDEAMSPLRRRMIEDMTIRKFAPKDPTRLHPHHQGFCCVPRPIARHGELRGRPTLGPACRAARVRRTAFRPVMSGDGQPTLAFFPEKTGCEQY
jgi:hypothetical protein